MGGGGPEGRGGTAIPHVFCPSQEHRTKVTFVGDTIRLARGNSSALEAVETRRQGTVLP